LEVNISRIKLDKTSKIFLFYIIICLSVYSYLFLETGTILGADAGRFAIISHIWYLKGITTDLRPYDMPSGFFYFPELILILSSMEHLGINPIDGTTILAFITSFLTNITFYFLAKKFIGRDKAVHAFFFYSMLFPITLNYAVFGTFNYAFSILWFYVLAIFSYEIFFEEKNRTILLGLALLMLALFHIYIIFVLISFLFGLITYEFVNLRELKRTKKLIFSYSKAFIIAFILGIPFLMLFYDYIPVAFDKRNTIDLLSFTHTRQKESNLYTMLKTIIISPQIGILYSSIYIIAFLFFVVTIKKFLFENKRLVILYFLIYIIFFNLCAFNDLNLQRTTSMVWIPYAMDFGLILTNPALNVATLPIFYFVQSPSPLYLINVFNPTNGAKQVLPYVIWSDYMKAMDFIKEEVPLNSTFLIDSGGSGCTAVSSSYGERIFPITERKIFFFTNYCWAEYNRSDYSERVDLYRRVSINPDFDVLEDIKKYNLTHVFIGPNDIGLKLEYFVNSTNYEMIYNESGFYIFKIK